MAGVLIQADFTYRSGAAPDLYTFTIVSDAATGLLSVRDIEDRYGMILNPYSQIPRSVTEDIGTAMSAVEGLLALTTAINGTLTFTSETSKTVTFAEALGSTNYRVSLSSSIFAPFRITGKTVLGFTIEAGASVSGTVGYDVFV